MRKKLSSAVLMLFLAFSALFFSPQLVSAEEVSCSISSSGSLNVIGLGKTIGSNEVDSMSFSLNGTPLDPGEYQLKVFNDTTPARLVGESTPVTVGASTATFTVTSVSGQNAFGYFGIGLEAKEVYLYNSSGNYCFLGYYHVEREQLRCGPIQVIQERNGQQCHANTNSCIQNGDVTVRVSGLKLSSGKIPVGEEIEIRVGTNSQRVPISAEGTAEFTTAVTSTMFGGNMHVKVYDDWGGPKLTGACTSQKVVPISEEPCPEAACSENSATETSDIASFALCSQIDQTTNKTAYDECIDCAGGEGTDGNPAGIYTAIGCIPREPGKIATAIIKVGLGIGGGFGLVSTLVAGFLYSISAGDVKKTDQAKEMLTNSLIGLVFIIFSVTILQFIGYNILRIPGFGG